MHIVLFLITYFLSKETQRGSGGYDTNPSNHSDVDYNENEDFETRQSDLKDLADEAHELRILPMPYGLLTHELIEVVDSERVMPGLSLISKLAEDFPWIDYHSRNKEGQREDSFKHRHQDVFVFGTFGSKSVAQIKSMMVSK